MNKEDENNLNLLSLFHYIVGGMTAFFACFPLIHMIIGIAFLSGSFSDGANGQAPPQFIGWIFLIAGGVFVISGWCMAIGIIIAGIKLKKRKNRIFCMVVASIECIFMPFGTILGVLTLIVLSKKPVKEAFENAGAGNENHIQSHLVEDQRTLK